MAALKSRNRLVNFRLTEEELESLRMACLVKGARNISDFTRSVVLKSVESEIQPQGLIQNQLTYILTRLSEIEAALQQMNDLLKGVLKGLVQSKQKEMTRCE